VGALVREDGALLVRLGPERGDQPAPGARDPVRADVVLFERPQGGRIVLGEDPLTAPGGEVAPGLLLRVGQGEMDDVVRAALEVLESFVGGDDVVRRSDERIERAGPAHVVADGPKRRDLRHRRSVPAVSEPRLALWR
jgi:hypothetical protein